MENKEELRALGISLFASVYTESFGVVYIVISIISAVFIYAIGEII